MQLEVGYLRYMLELLKKEYAHELSLLEVEVPVIREGIPELQFSEMKKIITEVLGKKSKGDDDISPDEERWISEYIKKET